jgi:hypothetical protein
MRLSDFQTPCENISTVESLLALDHNSTAAGKVVDWRGMKIGSTQGARETNPFNVLRQFARDAKGIDGAGKRQLHRSLDRIMDRDKSYSSSKRKRMHAAMDDLIETAENNAFANATEQGYNAGDDEEEGSNVGSEIAGLASSGMLLSMLEEDEESGDPNEALHEPEREEEDADPENEDDPDEEEPEEEASSATLKRRMHDALAAFAEVVRRSTARIPTASKPSSGGRAYIQDADTLVISKYVRPDETMTEAMRSLSGLFPTNGDVHALGYWSGLSTFLASFPQDTKISQVPQQTLAPLLRHLAANRAAA